MIRGKHIAVVYDDSGKCVHLAKVKTVSELELLGLNNELHEYHSKQDLEKALLLKRVKLLEEENKSLKSVISHILGYKELTEEEIEEILGVNKNEEE